MMRILVAPDKFKGSLGAAAVAENIAAGLREVLPRARIELAPVADGGEGTADIICAALQGNWIECDAHDSLGRKIKTHYCWIESRNLAVMEMSEAAGLRSMALDERDAMRATTFGVGEMLLDAAKRGAGQIIIGLGGSGTNDGGFGMARALGFRFFAQNDREHEHEHELRGAVSELVKLSRIERPNDLMLPRITAAADVKNHLLGKHGATRVFAPQKGANRDEIELLERTLTNLADTVAREFNCDFRDMPGAGAAGGLGFGLLSFCGATMRSGFDVVAEEIQLKKAIQQADVIVTGEGSLDSQTLQGKAPAGVARLAREHGKRVFAIVGRTSDERGVRELFDGIYELMHVGMPLEESIDRTVELVREKAREFAQDLQKTSDVQRPISNVE